MATFPKLSSGAICQYPLQVVSQQAVQIVRFIDGSDQRFLRQGRQFRRWEIRLDLLNEAELFALEDFFKGQLGDYSTFDFIDPLTSSVVSKCVVGNPVLVSNLSGVGRCGTSLWVVETNG